MISPDPTPYPENSLELSLQRRARSAELEPQIIKLAGEINAADYRFLKLLAEFDDNHGCGATVSSLSPTGSTT